MLNTGCVHWIILAGYPYECDTFNGIGFLSCGVNLQVKRCMQ